MNLTRNPRVPGSIKTKSAECFAKYDFSVQLSAKLLFLSFLSFFFLFYVYLQSVGFMTDLQKSLKKIQRFDLALCPLFLSHFCFISPQLK